MRMNEITALIAANQDLPIVPLVHEDDANPALAMIAFAEKAEIGEYAILDGEIYTDREVFARDYYDRHYQDLWSRSGLSGFSRDDEDEERRSDILRGILDDVCDEYFVPAILLYITTGEEEDYR